MPANLENSAVATRLNFIPIPKKGNAKNVQTTHNCTHLKGSEVMLKILQIRLQQYMNRELPFKRI